MLRASAAMILSRSIRRCNCTSGSTFTTIVQAMYGVTTRQKKQRQLIESSIKRARTHPPVELRFKQERHIQDQHSRPLDESVPQHSPKQGAPNSRMRNAIQLLSRLLIRKDELAKLGSIDLALIVQILFAKFVDDPPICRSSLRLCISARKIAIAHPHDNFSCDDI